MPLSSAEGRTTSDGKVITTRPATREMFTTSTASEQNKKRVCAYARVSTDKDEQLTSYEAQVDFYTKLIKSNPNYEFQGVFTDEGISATSTAKREGFRKMIAEAMDGKIDKILTKSVSRFARNTVDSLITIRKLKDKGVGVFFEKENIDTLDTKGELLITLMSSLAQEESRSISLNTTWGQRKRFSDGKVTMPFGHFLGYDRGEDGKPVINEKEAEIVRLIYKLYIDGKSTAAIARYLMAHHITSPGGVEKWHTTTINSILQNEKYRGDALLQKKFTVDFLTKRMKKNEGEVQQYYVQNSHPAIVTPEVFDLAQMERYRRTEGKIHICSESILAGKLFCGECGGVYGSKVWNSNSKYRRVIWQCNNKYGRKGKDRAGCAEAKEQGGFECPDAREQGSSSCSDVISADTREQANSYCPDSKQSEDKSVFINDGEQANSYCPDSKQSEDKSVLSSTRKRTAPHCTMPHVTEEQIKSAFVKMVNGMLEKRDEVLAFYDEVFQNLTDTSELQANKNQLAHEASEIKESMRKWIAENARHIMAKDQYQTRYDELNGKLGNVEAEISAITEKILLQNARRGHAAKVMEVMLREGIIENFDEAMFGGIIDRVIIEATGLVFRLKDGSERGVPICVRVQGHRYYHPCKE